MEEEFYKKYLQVRNEIDGACNELWGLHKENMQCRKECASCCQSFKVLPIEFNFIQSLVKDENVEVNKDASPKECKFLVNNKCAIYNFRPVICRTHGYPIVRMNEEAEAYEVSFCDLNFKDFRLDNFTENNVYFEDDFNSRLFKLNREYLENNPKLDFEPIELIELNKLKTE